MWLGIEEKPDIQHAPFHVLRQVQLLRLLPTASQEIVAPYVKSWHAHSESLLIAMLCSDDPGLPEFAVEKLLKVRNGSNCGDVSVRVFVPRPLNLNADSLRFLVDWEKITITESILTSHLSLDEISNLVEKKLECFRFPAHTQAVERLIREISEACHSVAGYRRRDGFIRARTLELLLVELRPMQIQNLTLSQWRISKLGRPTLASRVPLFLLGHFPTTECEISDFCL